MACPHKINRVVFSNFVIIATKDGETFVYEYPKTIPETYSMAKDMAKLGFSDIRAEWKHGEYSQTKTVFCFECNTLHFSE